MAVGIRVIWASMLVAVGAYWLVYRLVPIPVDESRFVLVAQVWRWLPVLATVLSVVAFVVHRTIPSSAEHATSLPRYVICWAIAEAIGVATLAVGIGLGVTGLDAFFGWAALLLVLLR